MQARPRAEACEGSAGAVAFHRRPPVHRRCPQASGGSYLCHSRTAALRQVASGTVRLWTCCIGAPLCNAAFEQQHRAACSNLRRLRGQCCRNSLRAALGRSPADPLVAAAPRPTCLLANGHPSGTGCRSTAHQVGVSVTLSNPAHFFPPQQTPRSSAPPKCPEINCVTHLVHQDSLPRRLLMARLKVRRLLFGSVSQNVGVRAPADEPVAATRLYTLSGLAPVVTSCETASRYRLAQ